MSSEGESVVTRQEAASSSYKPPPVHVPPRIDPDLYQAEIPDFKPDAEGKLLFASVMDTIREKLLMFVLLFGL